ncbi:MAG: exodeoxyribonuclease VII large subunit, partial [Thermoleophilaceae bacterium]
MAIFADTSTTPKVSQLATTIRTQLGELGRGWVEGEVQNLKSASSGHVYLRLADEDAVIDCCIWRSRAARLRPLLKEGTLVQAHYE